MGWCYSHAVGNEMKQQQYLQTQNNTKKKKKDKEMQWKCASGR